jgi:hypothetical protein
MSDRVNVDDFNDVPDMTISPDLAGVDLDGLLGFIEGFLRRFVVMLESQAVAVALWVAHTHVLDAFETTPYLSVTSATKRCGKSRLFDELELLVARPWKVVTPSEAVVFRKIEADKPTLLLDEIDAIFKDRNGNTEPLRALLNAGNRRGTKVPRCVGPTMQLVSFSVFCAKALAGIGQLPDTIGDRSIEIKLARKAPGETAARFRRREAAAIAEPLRTELAKWGSAAVAALESARPAVPEQLDDRAEEAWEPLLAIAELAGGAWPDRARRSALGLSTGEARDEEELGLRLLGDCRAAFEHAADDKLFTSRLIELLAEDDEAPWSDWYGATIKPRAVSRLLRPFGIRPRNVRVDESQAKGYHRDDFLDAWNRYPAVSDAVSVPSVPTAWLSQKQGDFIRPNEESGTDKKSVANPHEQRDGTDGTDRTPIPGDEGFLEHLLHVGSRGLITETEYTERAEVHELIVRGKAAPA